MAEAEPELPLGMVPMALPREAPPPPASWADLRFFREDWPALWQRLTMKPDWQPEPRAIFRALDLTPRDRVRVVILGQDPYPTKGRAQGLAFSFPPRAEPRDSLRNILRELASDTGAVKRDGDLSAWAKQGVLLLNTILTVPVGQALGHKGWGWERLTQEILETLAAEGPKAFLLWGKPAQKLCAKFPRAGHLFLEDPHPSPLSAHRGFFGSRPFSRINQWLEAQGAAPIDWGA